MSGIPRLLHGLSVCGVVECGCASFRLVCNRGSSKTVRCGDIRRSEGVAGCVLPIREPYVFADLGGWDYEVPWRELSLNASWQTA